VREWLSAQAAAGYVEYDRDEDTFYLNAEQATVFADEDSPAFMAGGFEGLSAFWIDEPKVSEAFRSGKGLAWHDHSACLFRGTERFFRPGYNANLVSSWLPALDGVVDKLKQGARVAGVGLRPWSVDGGDGPGLPAVALYRLRLSPRLDRACGQRGSGAGVAANTSFEVAQAKTYPGTYDLVAFFDCLHDNGRSGRRRRPCARDT
jgi:hypothetical protein